MTTWEVLVPSSQSLVIIWTRLRGGDGRLDPKVDKMHRKLQVGVSGEEEDTESCISAYEKPIYPIIFLNFFFFFCFFPLVIHKVLTKTCPSAIL